ncbi:ABC transporter permease [Pimelobacter simplex]|uniref:ABC transporter permease n=1 Tax=Nocardioides simplex TaxID=2045 RepID=UPI00214FC2CC|nr:ABC transporter permease subunit [Pimelobacter simplex]UUW91188.1 ABC transporter permease subunit [Pimelobacter simplex]UUW95016.1 ABC transporter permease subunit [Pimelobacter simplex]
MSISLRSRLSTRFLGTDVLVLVCLALFILPLVMAVLLAFQEGPPGMRTGWSLQGVHDGLGGGEALGVLKATALYSLAVTVLSTIGAVYFAWLFARTDAWFRALLPLVMIAIIVTPSLFYAIAFDVLGSPRTGLINEVLRGVLSLDRADGPFHAQSWTGMVLVAAIRSTAFSFVLIAPAMMHVARPLEEAARLAGAGRLRTLFTVLVPVVAPSIIGAAILAVIQTLEAFEIPLILGTPAGNRVLSTQVFALLIGPTGANYPAAAALALPVMGVIALLVVWQRRLLRGKEFVTVSGKSGSMERTSLGRTRPVHSAVILVFVAIGFLLPVAQIVHSAFGDRMGDWTSFTSRHVERMADDDGLREAIVNSWVLAGFGGLAIAVFCVVISWVVYRTSARRSAVLSTTVWLATTLPGILLGVAVFVVALTVPGGRGLFGTVWLMLLGLFIAAAPVGVRAADGPVRQISPELYEAARLHGAGPVRAWVSSVLPLLPPGLLAAWFVGAVVISSNVAVPLLLSTPQTTLLSVEAMTRYREGDVGVAASLILVNLVIWVGVGAVVLILSKLAGLRHNDSRAS